MTAPASCPVCNGHGTVSRPPQVAGDAQWWVSGGSETYPCRACDGAGVLWPKRESAPADRTAEYAALLPNLAERILNGLDAAADRHHELGEQADADRQNITARYEVLKGELHSFNAASRQCRLEFIESVIRATLAPEEPHG